MIPVRRNIDIDELVFWLDPDAPITRSSNLNAYSTAQGGKNLLAGTKTFSNVCPPVTDFSYGPSVQTPLNFTLSASGTPAPDGSGNPTTLITESLDIIDRTHKMRFDFPITPIIAGGPYEMYTHSIHLKVSSGSRTLLINNANNPSSGSITVDPSTGAIIATDPDNYDEGVESLGGGWYRFWYTVIFDEGTQTTEVRTELGIFMADATGDTTYQGDGTSGLIIYGHQWERGVLSNYVETAEGVDFDVFKNRKCNDAEYNKNPQYYPTTFDGTNFRFNGIESGLTSGFVTPIRRAPRPGLHPDGNEQKFSLLAHTLFAWINLAADADPDQGNGNWGLCATALGNVGGRNNNGVFGISPDGTQIIYKTRLQRISGGSGVSATNRSNSFASVTDKWALISCSFNMTYNTAPATVDFYLNGQLISSSNANASAQDLIGIGGSDGSLSIGYFNTQGLGPAGQFRGLLNICGIYHKALNATEHNALYNATKYKFV